MKMICVEIYSNLLNCVELTKTKRSIIQTV